ncbi:MAG: DMT family transporter [Bdellovibrionota bacterium]|jgi:drug/metabolite transporter (DMT)-like permease
MKFDKNYINLFFSAICFGLIIFGGDVMKRNGFSLFEVLAVPVIIISLFTFPVARKDFGKILRCNPIICIFYCLCSTVACFGQFAAIFSGLSVSLTAFLLYTQPLWTIMLGVLFFHERLKKIDVLIVTIMILGLVFLIQPWKDFSYSIAGVLWGLSSGILMSVWIILSAYFSKRDVHPISLVFFSYSCMLIPLLIVVLFFSSQLEPHPELYKFTFFTMGWKKITCVVLYAIFAYVLGNYLFFKASKTIPSIHLGLFVLMEPIVATMLDVIFLGTSLTLNAIVGSSLILLGNILIVLKE